MLLLALSCPSCFANTTSIMLFVELHSGSGCVGLFLARVIQFFTSLRVLKSKSQILLKKVLKDSKICIKKINILVLHLLGARQSIKTSSFIPTVEIGSLKAF